MRIEPETFAECRQKDGGFRREDNGKQKNAVVQNEQKQMFCFVRNFRFALLTEQMFVWYNNPADPKRAACAEGGSADDGTGKRCVSRLLCRGV